jgi:hypothetical protein
LTVGLSIARPLENDRYREATQPSVIDNEGEGDGGCRVVRAREIEIRDGCAGISLGRCRYRNVVSGTVLRHVLAGRGVGVSRVSVCDAEAVPERVLGSRGQRTTPDD